MIVNKLFLNGNYTKNPNNSLAMARNVRFDNDFENLINEEGFAKLHTFPQNICGIIPTDVANIVFCTNNNGDDYIYYVTEAQSTLYLKGNLNFSTNYPIKGEYQYNNKRDLIVVFNDTNNPLRVFNYHNPYIEVDSNKEFVDVAEGLNKLLLIPNYNMPIVSFNNYTPNQKGAMLKGTYHIVISYYINDYDRLNWSIPSLPIYLYKSSLNLKYYIGSQEGVDSTNVQFYDYFQKLSETLTNSSIEFTISDLDTQFKKYKVALIHRTDTDVKVYDMGDYSIETTYHNIVSVDTTVNSELSLDEVTVPYINFEKANDITISSDRLTTLGVTSKGLINYQKYANNIKVKYDLVYNNTTEVKTNYPVIVDNLNFLNTSIKTPILDEVYALNIGLVGTDGTVKGIFHIPGRAPIQFNPSYGEDSLITDVEKLTYNTNGDRNVPNEPIELDYYYQLYNTAAQASASTRYLGFWQNANEYYPDTEDFDIYSVDGSGVSFNTGTLRNKNVRHHRMPDINKLYVSGSIINTVRNSIALHVYDIAFPPEILSEIQGYFICYSTRNSSNSTVLGYHPLIRNNLYEAPNISALPANNDYKDIRTIRFNDYALLYNKPAIAKPYLKGVYTTDHNTHRQSAYYNSIEGIPIKFVPNLLRIKNYNTEIRKVNNYQYIPRDNNATIPNNKGREESLILHINSPYDDTDDTLICELKSNLSNVYSPFYDRRVSIASNITKVTDSYSYETAWIVNFDGFISQYNDILYLGDQTIGVDDDGLITRDNENPDKTKVLLAANCLNISTVNTNARSEEEANILLGSDFTEIGALTKLNGTRYRGNIPSDPAKDFGISYNKQYSFTNSIVGYYVYNYNNVFVDAHPYRVNRSAVQSKESLVLNWRYFSALEYYEMQKHRGIGKSILGHAELLLIHMEHGLFVARYKDKISTPEGDSFIGTADIFDRTPDELIPTGRGAAGIQSRFGYCVGEFGYMFGDTYDQSIYAYNNNSLQPITDDSVRNIFRKYMVASSGNPLTGNDTILGIDHINKRIIVTNLSTNFTLSYCYQGEARGWVCFHDYIPSIIVNNRVGSYSVNRNNLKELYKFNAGAKGTYYNGTKYESYIDVLINDNPKLDKVLHSVSLKSGLNDEANNINKLFVYTRNQCSKVYPLLEFENMSDYDKVRYLGGFWNYDLIRDYTNTPIIQSITNDFGTINESSINEGKAWYDLNEISDRFIIVRLITNNNTDMVFRDLEYNVSLNRR